MTSGAWTLLGVVVGAVLAGGSQVLLDRLRSDREQKQRMADMRRDVYARFVGSVTELGGWVNVMYAKTYPELAIDPLLMTATQKVAVMSSTHSGYTSLAGALGKHLAFSETDVSRIWQAIQARKVDR